LKPIQRTSCLFAVVGLSLAGIEARATSPTLPALHDGRYYEVVIADKISWEAAKAAAEQRTHDGVQGHLATIGSADEDMFLDQLRRAALGNGGELWVGGYQVACVTSNPEPGCGWLWINGEAISATNTDSPYTNWLQSEPNNLKRTPNASNRATEDHLAIGLGGAFGWNDEGSLGNIRGYVVEYGDRVTIPAAACAANGPGCNPTGAQVLQYPATAEIAPDATLTAQTFLIRDDPNRCGNQPLTLFDGAVVIPAYLCGHPDFLVIETQASGVEVLSGTVLVENLTEDVLPANLYGCNAVRQNPAGQIDPDPSHRDVVAWQSSDSAEMPESVLGTGRFYGTLAEVTYGCGSSRGKILSGSYHFVGLRIHPGVGNEFIDGNALGNHKSFVELTAYKLKLLRASVIASKPALPALQYYVLKGLVDSAIHFHGRGRYKLALLDIKLFLYVVERTKYKAIPGENFSGDHNMRGSNIEFTYTNKLIPFSP
jgi:hypothetical protein